MDMSVFLVCITFLVSPLAVDCHGRLVEPPSRASMWRFGYKNPENFADNQMFCGGYTRQWQKNGGRCGICGDPWDDIRENEAGGKFANGIIVRRYQPGHVVLVIIELTAAHLGYFEFRICPNNNPKKRVTQECLDRQVMELADDSGTRYYITDSTPQNYEILLKLPANVECSQCVIQWMYHTGNSWGQDGLSPGCLGCGPQEEFYGCADVAIGNQTLFDQEYYILLAREIEENRKKELQNLITTDQPLSAAPPVHSSPPLATPPLTDLFDKDYHALLAREIEETREKELQSLTVTDQPLGLALPGHSSPPIATQPLVTPPLANQPHDQPFVNSDFFIYQPNGDVAPPIHAPPAPPAWPVEKKISSVDNMDQGMLDFLNVMWQTMFQTIQAQLRESGGIFSNATLPQPPDFQTQFPDLPIRKGGNVDIHTQGKEKATQDRMLRTDNPLFMTDEDTKLSISLLKSLEFDKLDEESDELEDLLGESLGGRSPSTVSATTDSPERNQAIISKQPPESILPAWNRIRTADAKPSGSRVPEWNHEPIAKPSKNSKMSPEMDHVRGGAELSHERILPETGYVRARAKLLERKLPEKDHVKASAEVSEPESRLAGAAAKLSQRILPEGGHVKANTQSGRNRGDLKNRRRKTRKRRHKRPNPSLALRRQRDEKKSQPELGWFEELAKAVNPSYDTRSEKVVRVDEDNGLDGLGTTHASIRQAFG